LAVAGTRHHIRTHAAINLEGVVGASRRIRADTAEGRRIAFRRSCRILLKAETLEATGSARAVSRLAIGRRLCAPSAASSAASSSTTPRSRLGCCRGRCRRLRSGRRLRGGSSAGCRRAWRNSALCQRRRRWLDRRTLHGKCGVRLQLQIERQEGIGSRSLMLRRLESEHRNRKLTRRRRQAAHLEAPIEIGDRSDPVATALRHHRRARNRLPTGTHHTVLYGRTPQRGGE
jgi:hypothetical protein